MFPPKACLFDLDGILLDTEHLHGQAWSETASAFGKKLSADQLISLRGQRRIDCAIQITKLLPKQIGTKELLQVHEPIWKSLLSQSQAIPGAEKLVRFCSKQNIPMALVTSSSKQSVSTKSSPHPWLNLINLRVFGDDTALEAGKPSPAPYLLAAKRLNFNPNECWAIEDSLAGTSSALKAGCKVWVLCHQPSTNNQVEKVLTTQNPIKISHLNYVYLKLLETLKVSKNN